MMEVFIRQQTNLKIIKTVQVTVVAAGTGDLYGYTDVVDIHWNEQTKQTQDRYNTRAYKAIYDNMNFSLTSSSLCLLSGVVSLFSLIRDLSYDYSRFLSTHFTTTTNLRYHYPCYHCYVVCRRHYDQHHGHSLHYVSKRRILAFLQRIKILPTDQQKQHSS